MTFIGWIASLFPVMHLGMILASLTYFAYHSSLISALILLFILYLFPPLLLQLYSFKHPPRPGKWKLNTPTRNDWWIAHQLQGLYPVFPFLESILRLIPGAYSSWLRLWGSKVGKKVYWTPNIEIVDRHLLTIGDGVIFGHRAGCVSHLIIKKPQGDLFLIVRPIEIGHRVFLGGAVRIGPGVKIPNDAIIPYNSEFRFRYEPPLHH